MPEKNYSHDPHIPPVPQPKLVTAPPKPQPEPEGDDDIDLGLAGGFSDGLGWYLFPETRGWLEESDDIPDA